MSTGLLTLQIDDLSIAYARAGHGPALVLLHGFLCDSRCWRQQLEHLSNDFTVIAWDAPGAGRSSRPLWLYCAWAAFALALAEWWTWQRRITLSDEPASSHRPFSPALLEPPERASCEVPPAIASEKATTSISVKKV